MSKPVIKKPTEAQIKEFWEWCGWKYKPDELCGDPRSPHIKHSYGWLPPDDYKWQETMPDLDLNNLFKSAVPKVEYYLSLSKHFSRWLVKIEDQTGEKRYIDIDEDPALALFWAIWEVIHNV